MGYFKKKNWHAKKPEKKIYKLENVIDLLNEALDAIAKSEKQCLELENATTYGGIFPKFASRYMKRKERSELTAKYYASMRPPVLEEWTYEGGAVDDTSSLCTQLLAAVIT